MCFYLEILIVNTFTDNANITKILFFIIWF